jgi:thymidylate synthase (FAD)
MLVHLLQHTPDPEQTVALAARLCYSPASIGALQERIAAADVTSFLDKIMSLGHLSVLEHVSFTFGVEGISRACSHQLVRHRLASYSQQSQRYVKSTGDEFPQVVPASISTNPERARVFAEAMQACAAAYRQLIDAGVPAEDARFVLPNAAETKIILTMNARELRHFFELRCCERAQWEIRHLAIQMLRLVKPLAPTLFADAGPGCVAGSCPEGTMTCGQAAGMRKKFKEMS